METRGRRLWAVFCVAVLVLADATAEELPEIELLEFLADWQDADGAVVDPGMFENEPRAAIVPASEDLSRVPEAPDELD